MAEVDGVQRAIFGAVSPEELRQWLNRHVALHLDSGVATVLFGAGAIGAVFGLRLDDGRDVVLKALRPEADEARMQAVVDAQNRLAATGFGCAAVLAGPNRTNGVLAIVEEYLPCTSSGSPHQPPDREAMATGLAAQIAHLSGMDGAALVTGRPGWTNWERGAWPEAHDPIFDFNHPVEGFEWLDALADDAAGVLLRTPPLRCVVGHTDWVWQNVCVRHGGFVAGFDWDSLAWLPECAVVGLSGGAFTQGSPAPPDAPAAHEVDAFIEEYQAARGRRFDTIELAAARAAATWVRCYNARCQVDNRLRGLEPPDGSFIAQLEKERST